MTIKQQVLDALVAAGATAEMIVAAIKADQSKSSGARRQAEYRARKASLVTSRYVTLRNAKGSNGTSSPSPHVSITLTPTPSSPLTPKPSISLRSIDGARLKKASRLPEDWVLPENYRDWARAKTGWPDDEINRQAARMLNWSRSTQSAVKLDWYRTWQNWIGNLPPQHNGYQVQNTAYNRQSVRGYLQEFQRQADENKTELDRLKAEAKHE